MTSLLRKPDRDPLPYWMANLVLFFCNRCTVLLADDAVCEYDLDAFITAIITRNTTKAYRVGSRVGSMVLVVQITSYAEPAALR